MMLRYQKAVVFILAGGVYLVGQYYRGVWFLGSSIPSVCGEASFGGVPFCNSPYLDTFGWPLIFLGQILFIIAIILCFANAATIYKWLKFSLYYIPIAVFLDYLIYPVRFSPFGETLQQPQGVYPFGWLYVIITLGIVLWSFRDSRKH